MLKILPVASGKGGVGKSVLAANLGLALARQGKTVILVDLDLGGSNLHTCLGLRNRHEGLGSYVWRKEKSLSSLLVETGQDRLWLIPGDNLLPGTANLDWNLKRRILRDLSGLPADYAVLDLGAGSSWNIVDFYLATGSGLIVITPEITSVLNAYSFLKTSAFRCLSRSFPEGSEARRALEEFASTKNEGSGQSFLDFATGLAAKDGERGRAALERLSSLMPLVVLNRVQSHQDVELAYRLRDISRKNLGLALAFSGLVLEDPNVPRSIAKRTPLLLLEPDSPFCGGVEALARRIALGPEPSALFAQEGAGGADSDEALEALAAEAFGRAEED